MKRTSWIAVAILASVARHAGRVIGGGPGGGRGNFGRQPSVMSMKSRTKMTSHLPMRTNSWAESIRWAGQFSNRFATLSGYAQVMEGSVFVMTEKGFKRWNMLNIFETFERAGLDDWLFHEKGIPRPIQGPNAGTWQRKRQIRLSRADER